MSTAERELYEFEGFRLDVGERIFERKGQRIELTDRAFDVLCILVRNPGRLVTKDQILAEVWPDTYVEENSINKNVSLLRRQLASGSRRANFIETVRGRGFRFLPAVTSLAETEATPAHVVDRGTTLPDRPPANKQVNAHRVGNVVALREWRPRPVEAESASTRPELMSSHEDSPATRRFRSRRWLPIIAAAVLLAATGIAFVGYFNRPIPPDSVRTIAVLPFKPLAVESSDAAFEMGIADTLISKLSGSRKLIVRPLSAVRRYASLESDELVAGRELEVDAVLSGSVQRSGDKVRVNVRLTRVADSASLWSGTFDENLTDIFIVQDAISRKVVSALEVSLNVDEQAQIAKHFTTSPQAYEFYVRGREQVFRVTPDALAKSIELFEKAIQADPNYALAYSGLADAYRTLLVPALKSPEEVGPKAVANATRALDLDESLPEAHIARGWLYLFYDWDWQRAETSARRAIELAPYNSEGHRLYAHILSVVGRHEEAVEEGRNARELAPLTLITAALEGQFLFYAGRLDEAEHRLQRALEIDPNFWVTWNSLARVYIARGRYDEAIDVLNKARQASGGSPEPAGQLGYVLAKAGRRDEAIAILKELESARNSRFVPMVYLAMVYCGLGDKENSLTWLERSIAAREGQLIFIKIDSRWDWLRDEPRFKSVINQMKPQ